MKKFVFLLITHSEFFRFTSGKLFRIYCEREKRHRGSLPALPA